MRKTEAYRLVAVAAAAFPGMQDKELGPTAEVWHQLLQDLEYPIVEGALQIVLRTADFFPKVSEIRKAAEALLPPSGLPTPEAAWEEVMRQVDKVGRTGTPKWSDPAVGKAAEALYGGWLGLCRNLSGENSGVDRAHFYRIYKSMTEREQALNQLPAQIKTAVLGLREKLALPPGTGDT